MGRRYVFKWFLISFTWCLLSCDLQNYLKHSLVSTSERLKVDIICKDVVEALKLIVHENYEADDFVKESEKKIEDGKRVYSEPATGNWWTDIEVTSN